MEDAAAAAAVDLDEEDEDDEINEEEEFTKLINHANNMKKRMDRVEESVTKPLTKGKGIDESDPNNVAIEGNSECLISSMRACFDPDCTSDSQ